MGTMGPYGPMWAHGQFHNIKSATPPNQQWAVVHRGCPPTRTIKNGGHFSLAIVSTKSKEIWARLVIFWVLLEPRGALFRYHTNFCPNHA